MKLGAREIVVLNLMLALLGASWWFGFKQVDERKQQFREEMALKQRELGELKEATADVEDLGRRVDELQQAIDFFEGKLPREKEVDKILRDVWRAAERNRLEIGKFETLKVRRDSHYSEQPIKLELAGDFEGFYAYLLELESLKRITRVTGMTLTKLEQRNGAMEAEMVLSIFFEPSGSSAAQPALAAAN